MLNILSYNIILITNVDFCCEMVCVVGDVGVSYCKATSTDLITLIHLESLCMQSANDYIQV